MGNNKLIRLTREEYNKLTRGQKIRRVNKFIQILNRLRLELCSEDQLPKNETLISRNRYILKTYLLTEDIELMTIPELCLLDSLGIYEQPADNKVSVSYTEEEAREEASKKAYSEYY